MRDFNLYYIFFFFNDTATTEIYTLSLHDALPISNRIADHKPIPIHPSHHSAEAELESHPGSHGNPERQQTLVLQPGFTLACPLVPVASSCALPVAPAPVGPAQDGGGTWAAVPDEPRSEKRRVGKEC